MKSINAHAQTYADLRRRRLRVDRIVVCAAVALALAGAAWMGSQPEVRTAVSAAVAK